MRSAARLPDGVVDLRKVKTVLGESGRAHLTWVIAYNAGIEVGSERYETIRAFGGGLKPPRNTEQSVMFLPIAPPDVSQAPAPQPRKKPRAKARAKPAAKSRSRAAPKRVSKLPSKTRPKPGAKAQAKRPAKSRAKLRSAKARSRPAHAPRKARRFSGARR